MFYCCGLACFHHTQGLYEYAMPSWQERVHPKVEDYDVKKFGSTVPAKVLNPDSNPVKAIEAGKMDGVVLPRLVLCFDQEVICRCF